MRRTPITVEQRRRALRRLSDLANGCRGWLSVGYDPEVAGELARVDEALAWERRGLFGRCCDCAQQLDPAAVLTDPADIRCEPCNSGGDLQAGAGWMLAALRVA